MIWGSVVGRPWIVLCAVTEVRRRPMQARWLRCNMSTSVPWKRVAAVVRAHVGQPEKTPVWLN